MKRCVAIALLSLAVALSSIFVAGCGGENVNSYTESQ